MNIFVIIFLVLIYLFYAIFVLRKLIDTTLYSKNQKVFHGIMIFILPFFWGPFIQVLTKPDPKPDELFKQRKDSQNIGAKDWPPNA